MNKIIAILLLTITTAFGQEQDKIITNTSLGFSRDVLQVRETDSVDNKTTLYKFNNEGYLIEETSGNEVFTLKRTYQYKDNKIIERTKTFKNAYTDHYENETFVYDGDKIMSAKHTVNSLDENTGDYKDKAVQSFTYEGEKLKSVKKVYSGGRKAEENYFYTPGDTLFRTRLIIDDSFEDGNILNKEYKNGNRVVIDSYNEGENVPYGREIRIYNDDGKLINQGMYSEGEKWNEYKYVYENGVLLKAQFYEMGDLRQEFFNDRYGHLIKNIQSGITTLFRYEYNEKNDPLVMRSYSESGELYNVRSYEYVYR